METKQCTKCKEVKQRNEFPLMKTRRDRLIPRSHCHPCYLLAARERNLAKRNARPRVIIEDLPGEVWVDVKGYEGRYMVSNMARVKSVDRWVFQSVVNKDVFRENRLLSQSMANGYHSVTLYSADGKKKPICVYPLVFFSFNPHIEKKKGWHIDHVDQNRGNSTLANLQYVTQRENFIRRSLNLKNRSSQYLGVSWCKGKLKWQTGIRYEGQKYSLGRYDSELEAAEVYSKALSRIEQGLHPIE